MTFHDLRSFDDLPSGRAQECRTGLPLLRVMDKLQPGCVDWARVNSPPRQVEQPQSRRDLAEAFLDPST